MMDPDVLIKTRVVSRILYGWMYMYKCEWEKQIRTKHKKNIEK